LLCAILTRPGDGRGANYILGVDGKIYCIDNDVSLVELMSSVRMFKQTNICSLLFCLSQKPLDIDTLIKFTQLDPESILHSWVEELIEKEKDYTTLFTKEERKKFYEEDKENRFTPFLLLKEGAISTLCLQFIHLQQTLKARLKTPLYAQDLLQMLISIKDTPQQTTGIQVAKQYAKASTKPPSERLKAATGVAAQSKSTSQTMEATFGKILTFEEIEKRETYSLDKAKKELLLLLVQRYINTENATLLQKDNNGSLHAHFEAITSNGAPDYSRQELILKALHLLIDLGHFPQPQEVTLADCVVLKDTDLLPFLSPNLRFLNLRNCPSITQNTVEQIAKTSPNIEELYLSGSGIETVAEYGIFSWYLLSMPKLKILHAARCQKLQAIYLSAPKLIECKVDQNPQLQQINLANFPFWVQSETEECPKLLRNPFKSRQIEKFPKKLCEAILKLLASKDHNLITQMNPFLYQIILKKLKEGNDKKIIEECQRNPIKNLDFQKRDYYVQNEGAEALAAAFERNSSLESLILRYNSIGDKGAKALAASLLINQSLLKLDLSDNDIADERAKALAPFLEKNQTLLKLDLSSNDIADERAKALAASLEKNQTLLELDLRHNQIGDKSTEAFAKALEKNQSLQKLDLRFNFTGNKGTQAIAKSRKKNQSVCVEICSYSDFSKLQKEQDAFLEKLGL
ncbi:MAG: hypothetical protein K1000chlam2_01810, partial [Chlamydiae bacterium]|nr:hypothetical protein [Chlamydiota bacterium]